MKRAAFAFVLLSSCSLLFAQNQPSVTTLTIPGNLPANSTSAAGCPVAMNARQGIWDHTIRVQNGPSKPREGFGQHISLTLVDTHAATIVDATVKVLGLSGRNRMLNTGAGANGAADASRVVHLTAFSAANNGVTAELYAPGFTSVTTIQLLAITYANGSTWTAPPSAVCRVAPDPMMLIANH